MTEENREQVLRALELDWGLYGKRFLHLSPDGQKQFLEKQGYDRFGDLLAHIIAWWEEGMEGILKLLEEPDGPANEYEVDAFNARAVQRFRGLSEEAVQLTFQAARLDLLDLIESLPESAFDNPRIIERLRNEVIGHLREHEI